MIFCVSRLFTYKLELAIVAEIVVLDVEDDAREATELCCGESWTEKTDRQLH